MVGWVPLGDHSLLRLTHEDAPVLAVGCVAVLIWSQRPSAIGARGSQAPGLPNGSVRLRPTRESQVVCSPFRPIPQRGQSTRSLNAARHRSSPRDQALLESTFALAWSAARASRKTAIVSGSGWYSSGSSSGSSGSWYAWWS